MRIAVMQASSQISKNALMYEAVKKYAKDAEVINFGCDGTERTSYSYIEIAVLIGMLLASKAVDLVVTGCSSGQGMMLACNSMPGVICAYAPTPDDAYLFAQINNGNAVSLPLGEGYTYKGPENLKKTIEKLLSEPFGQGWPKEDAPRKKQDTALLKSIRQAASVTFADLLETLESSFLAHVLTKKNVIDYILENGRDRTLVEVIGDMAGKV